ncbi:MAG: lactate utilization protein [Gammaproteobacteria bacterium]|nr:lactate utilization protein [Gammaproteobacteria bacterium]MDH3464704.1 lactate utilization protein [Gammaproteobacteria bacterium]
MSDSARNAVLDSVRKALGRDCELDASIETALDGRLNDSGPHVLPVFDEPPLERFVDKLETVHATTVRVAGVADIAAAIDSYIGAHRLPTNIVVARSALLDNIDWPAAFHVEHRGATVDDVVSVTEALAGIAETGTLVCGSSESHPTSLNFLPENHVVVISESRLYKHMEEVWQELRRLPGGLPRAVNLITGPSKTADVEQTIQYGAHGPRRLHVIIIEQH